MHVFVAGVSSELQYVKGINSFHWLRLGAKDKAATQSGATGLYGRKVLCNTFLEGPWDTLLMIDLDMAYPEDTLARLREHDLDMVTGHYYRRQIDPAMSIWEVSDDGSWPYRPVLDVPQSGLHELASTGMGCVLIKRHVIEAVANELPPLSHPFDNGPLPWLTGNDMALGQDKRFFAIARSLGYKLYGDAEVRCSHAVTAWIDDNIYERIRNRRSQARLSAGLWLESLRRNGVDQKTIKLRLQTLSLEREHLLEEFNRIKEGKSLDELQPYVLQLNEYDNRMAECHDWITGFKAVVKWPNAPENAREEFEKQRTGIPTGDMEELNKAREGVETKEAMMFVEALDGR